MKPHQRQNLTYKHRHWNQTTHTGSVDHHVSLTSNSCCARLTQPLFFMQEADFGFVSSWSTTGKFPKPVSLFPPSQTCLCIFSASLLTLKYLKESSQHHPVLLKLLLLLLQDGHFWNLLQQDIDQNAMQQSQFPTMQCNCKTGPDITFSFSTANSTCFFHNCSLSLPVSCTTESNNLLNLMNLVFHKTMKQAGLTSVHKKKKKQYTNNTSLQKATTQIRWFSLKKLQWLSRLVSKCRYYRFFVFWNLIWIIN